MSQENGPTARGGLWGEEMDSLHVVLMKPYLEIVGEYYKRAVMEKDAHRTTLTMFARVVAGEIPIEALIVTPDGWEIRPERPPEAVPMGEDPLSYTLGGEVIHGIDGNLGHTSSVS